MWKWMAVLVVTAALVQGSLVQELSPMESGDGVFDRNLHTGELGASDWNDSDPFGTPYHISQEDFRKGKNAKIDMDYDRKDRQDLSTQGMVAYDPTPDAKAAKSKALATAMKGLPQVDGLSSLSKTVQRKAVDPFAPVELLQNSEGDSEATVETLDMLSTSSTAVDKRTDSKSETTAMFGLFGAAKKVPTRWFKKAKKYGPLRHQKAVSKFDAELEKEEAVEKKDPLNKIVRKREMGEDDVHDDSMEVVNSHEHSAYSGIGIVHGDIGNGYGQESPWGREELGA